MVLSSPLDILKEAILLERRGRALYLQAAAVATVPAVQAFFQTMADEEQHHMEVLEGQFAAYDQTGAFLQPDVQEDEHSAVADRVLGPDLKEQIAGAGFEAAAISAAILMEEKAVNLYSQRAKISGDAHEHALYQWLVDWEQSHLRFLVQLDKEIRQSIWQDNGFWPF